MSATSHRRIKDNSIALCFEDEYAMRGHEDVIGIEISERNIVEQDLFVSYQ